jgi:hypothetical protein
MVLQWLLVLLLHAALLPANGGKHAASRLTDFTCVHQLCDGHIGAQLTVVLQVKVSPARWQWCCIVSGRVF